MQPDLLRYSCQMALPNFTETTQQQLQNAKVLIVGIGGLGCPTAQYLTAAGIGTLGIADFDVISISNLHRQILYTHHDVGLKKAIIASQKLQQQNPFIQLIAHDMYVTSHNIMELIKPYDIVVDGTDNFETRYLLNDACVLTGKPLVYGAIYQYEGQVAVWNIIKEDRTRTPNYRDLFPEVNAAQIPNCADGGVIPTIAGIIGCMQANEVIKYITKSGELLAGKVLMIDAQTLQSRIIKIGSVTKTNITSIIKTENIPTISIAHLKKVINENRYDLIDVRNKDEHTAFNIGGKNIPLSDMQNGSFYLEAERPLVFYCASGKRSSEAVKQLKKRFPNIELFSLEGGIKAWLEQL